MIGDEDKTQDKYMPNQGRPDGVRVTAGRCVRCSQPVVARYRPFCSERCSELDLARWLTGQYRIPTDEVSDSAEIDNHMEGDQER
mgnify:CR=1 FL=1